ALGAILLASLPTAQFILPFEHLGVFSTRMHWYIFIVWSIVLGYFLSHLKSQMNDRRGLNILLVVFSLVYFSFAFYGGRVAAKQVAAASEFSKAAYEKFTEYCACASTKSPQTVGLPTHYRTVNVYTGEEWLDHVAYFSGLPLCQSERERCEIRYHVRPQAQVSVTAQKISQSILERVHLPEEEDTERLGCFALSKGFPATLKSKKNLRLRGRIIKECDIRGDERFYLLVDGKLLLFADLNMPLRGKAEKEGNVLRGFLFEVPASSLPVGEHEYELVAVSAAKSVHVAKRSVTRARA
ncbi:MAG: hypothetical protein KDD55_11945, partial [Bdellovibrionales bacterium]|nr:hypothetical protein [Bdellovibrionales bacterium]